VEYHALQEKQFCSGVQFVAKQNGIYEDDGWVITYVHDEGTNMSQVIYYIKLLCSSKARYSIIFVPIDVLNNYWKTWIVSTGVHYRRKKIFRRANSENYFATKGSIRFPRKLFLQEV